MRNQRGNKLTGEETAGKPPQEPPSPQKLRCFQDILDIVFSLSDEEWRTLSSDVPNAGTKLQFACLSTKIVISVCRSAIQSYLPTLIRAVGMETVLMAEEKLKKKAESASMSSSTNTVPSEHSAQRSAVDPSDQICIIVEDFVCEVKMAMQRAICKVASYKASSWSKDWKTTCSLVAKEMLNILETKAQPSHHEDTHDLREEQDKDGLHTEALTRKVIMVVLDVLDSGSAGRADSKTGDLLITAAEKLIEMTSSSQSERLSRHKKKHKARLSHEDLRVTTTRAVSQVLLSSAGVWERNSSSSEMPSSLASQTDLDSMLEAMTKAGFPTDLIEHNLVVTSRDIVSTIESNMDTLSSTSPSSKKKNTEDSGVLLIMNYMIHRIKERLKIFFRVTKQLEKERGSAEPSSNVSQDSQTLMAKPVHRAKSQAPSVNSDFQTDDPTVICTDEQVGTESLFRTCCQSQTVLSTQGVPTSDVQLSRVHAVSQLDDLTVTCTNSIISEIVHLYHSDVSSECPASATDKDSVEIRDIFQGLGELVRTSRSPSKTSSSDKDLGQCEDISLPKLDVSKVDPALDQTSLHRSLKSLLSAQFQSQATQTVCDVLLKTGEKLSISSFYTEAQSTASDIVTSFLKKLWKCCFSAPPDNAGTLTKPTPNQKKQVPSASQSIYRGVHKKVFGFLLGLQKSDKSEKSDKSVISVQDQPKTRAELESVTLTGLISVGPERSTDREVGAIFDSAAEILAVTQPQSLQRPASEMNQPDPLISDETLKSHADSLTNLMTDILINTADPSHVWKHSSDSVLETSWVRSSLLRDPIQVPSSLVYVFVDDSVKGLLLHLLRLNPAFSSDQSASFTFSDRHLQRSSAGFEGQNSDKSTGLTEAQNHSTEALTDSQSKMENPLSLLVKSEHSERNHDVSVLDVRSVCESPTTSSTAGTAMGRETLENLSISSQQYETYSSSSRPVSESCSYYPNPLDMKKRRGFRFIVGKIAPLFNIRLKKSSKVCPAGLVSDSHQYPSTSGNLQKSSQRESKVLMTPFKKTRNHLSRIFSAVHRALPNPFQCLTPPS